VIECTRPACDRVHLCVKTKSATALFWRVLILGFLQLGLNPTIFRVSLNSTNRLVNTEKHTCNFGEEFIALKEAIFSSVFFSLYFILFYEDD
jgi:hypothetical protein